MTIYDGRVSFYQWDLNQKVTSDTFQVGDMIHFFSMRHPTALVTKAYLLENKVVADVPNILLQTTNPIRVYRYISDSTSAQTVEERVFIVNQKPQPPDYFYTETELYELRSDVERAVENANNIVVALQRSVGEAEQKRELAESDRRTAELTRESNESDRVDQERERVSAEDERFDAETLRAEAESTRVVAEDARVAAEQDRASAEISRQTAEQERQSAETLRQSTFEQSYNNVANALKGSASGEVIRVDDVSPIDHTANVVAFGKNRVSLLAPCDTRDLYHGWLVNPNGKTITISISDKDTSVDISGMYLGLTSNGKNPHAGVFWLVNGGSVKQWTYTSSTLPYVSIYYGDMGKAIDALTRRFNIQVEIGETATEYEPYIDPSTIKLTAYGKNLITYPYQTDTRTQNGGTLTVSEDGGIRASGTPTGDCSIQLGNYIIPKWNSDITFSIGGNYSNVRLVVYFAHKDGSTIDYILVDNTKTINVLERYPEAEVMRIYASVKTYNQQMSGALYPMVELGNVASDYEKGRKTEYTPSENGTIDIASVSPTMTLFADTEGVTIEAEYNRDANLVVSDLQSQIDSLKEIINELRG